ncbi:MAG TPA: adenylate/guanylate cyclase domain-containing protein [Ramlibacter sp.]|nr:adenylate/guanylate cyclase domain-containing protein [Ramlibacter sp.]
MSRDQDRSALESQANALLANEYGSEDRYDFAARAGKLAQALVLYRTMGDKAGQVKVLALLANVASNVADHVGALDYLREAGLVAAGDEELDRVVRGQMGIVLLELGDLPAALDHATAEWNRCADAPDPETCLMAHNGLGCVLIDMGRYDEGIGKIRSGIDHLQQMPAGKRKTHCLAQSLADLAKGLIGAGDAGAALVQADEGAIVAAGIDHAPLVALNRLYAGRAAIALGKPEIAIDRLQPAIELAKQMGLRSTELQARFELASALAAQGRHQEAYESYRTAHAMEKEVRRDEAFRRAEFLRARAEIEQAQKEKEESERILFSVLPKAIATRMSRGEARIADEIEDVSVLFADLVGFTALSTTMTPRDLLELLERVFHEFDRLAADHQLEKVKTIGDAYMVVGGALHSGPGHLERSAHLAMAMLRSVERLAAETGLALSIRIGLHAGPAIAGVIGRDRLSYDMWGETVNLASRLESSGVPGRIHVASSDGERLRNAFKLEPRGPIALKGFGDVETCFVSPLRSAGPRNAA